MADTPEWIKKIKAQDEAKRAQAEDAAKRAQHVDDVVTAKGESFWNELIKQLETTVEGLPSIGINAQLTALGSAPSGHGGSPEQGRQIYLTAPGQIAYTNVFYRPGTRVIRCHPANRASFELSLDIDPEDRVVATGQRAMYAAETAQYLVEPLVGEFRPN
jgi:hypothetical protein